MKAKKGRVGKKPALAAGDYDYLEEKATRDEIKRGDFTRVTRLALDEVDPV